ncbi:MAG: hypothetical protein EOM77_04740 [Bacteroidia bacterium]|nr:hypothetical protein [Bacteroidia bacterium]
MTKIILPFLLSFVFVLSSCDKPTDSSSSSSQDNTSSDSSSESNPDVVYEDYYNGYYSSIESWENGDDLRTKLNELVNYNVTLVDFNGSQKWAANQIADEAFDNFDRVNLVYSDYQPLKTYTFTGSNQGWQREHAFAQTLGNFDTSNTRPESEETLVNTMRSDFHNLFASDGRLNNSRGNKNLGNVTEAMGTIVYPTDYNGVASGCRAIQDNGGVTVNVFEPRTEDKPMMARGIFYMATRFSDLNVVSGIAASRSKTHGMLEDLLSWSDNPVTRREYKHNVGVYSLQNNRNPYVDFPELVDYVFGDLQGEGGELEHLRPSYYDVVINEGEEVANAVHNLAIKNVKTSYQVGEAFSKANDLKVFTVNNDLSVNSDLAVSAFGASIEDAHIFTSAEMGAMTNTVTYGNLSVAYDLEVAYDPSLLATYKYKLTSTDAFNGIKKQKDVVHNINLGGLSYNFYFQSGMISDFSKTLGRKFGTESDAINNMYLETSSSFTFGGKSAVNAIYVIASTASSPGNPKIDVKIGDYSFTQQSMVVGTSGNNTLYSFLLPSGETREGKVRIAFSGFTGGALYLNRFAINAA